MLADKKPSRSHTQAAKLLALVVGQKLKWQHTIYFGSESSLWQGSYHWQEEKGYKQVSKRSRSNCEGVVYDYMHIYHRPAHETCHKTPHYSNCVVISQGIRYSLIAVSCRVIWGVLKMMPKVRTWLDCKWISLAEEECVPNNDVTWYSRRWQHGLGMFTDTECRMAEIRQRNNGIHKQESRKSYFIHSAYNISNNYVFYTF